MCITFAVGLLLLGNNAVDERVRGVAGLALAGVDGILLDEGAAAAEDVLEALHCLPQAVRVGNLVLVLVDGVRGECVDQQGQEQIQHLHDVCLKYINSVFDYGIQVLISEAKKSISTWALSN